jgi:hypothetical protein
MSSNTNNQIILPEGFPNLPPGFPNLPPGFPNLPPGFQNLPEGFRNVPPQNLPTLSIAIPSKTSVHCKTVLCMLDSCLGGNNAFNINIRILEGKSNIHHARSILLTQWYDSAKDNDLFLFIDADQTFNKNDIIELIKLDSDVACGVYCSSAGLPNVCPKDHESFFKGKSKDVLYSATGFMLIRKPILTKAIKFLEKEHPQNITRFWISPAEQNIIPFFKERFVEDEIKPESGSPQQWLGEDYSFCWLIRRCGGNIKANLSKTIGHDVQTLKFFFPDCYEGIEWPSKSIVYHTGQSRLKWSPKSGGLGGSETAIIKLTSYWIKKGYTITVYGNVEEGTYDSVKYLSADKFSEYDKYDILILWRGYGLQCIQQVKARVLLVDLHDNTDKSFFQPNFITKMTKVMFKSKFHRLLFPMVPDDKAMVIPNAVETELIDAVDNIKREHTRCIYTSSYDRGLEEMLKWGWPEIKREIPQAEFHIFYGMGLNDPAFISRMLPLLSQPGVIDHGKVKHDELAVEYKKSMFNYYTTASHVLEVDCISVKEALYAGCIPVLSNLAAFPERPGIHIDGDPSKKEFHIETASKIINLMKHPKMLQFYQDKLKAEIPDVITTWDKVAMKWLKLF